MSNVKRSILGLRSSPHPFVSKLLSKQAVSAVLLAIVLMLLLVTVTGA